MIRNRGTAAVLAMIFLAVFAVLGISFYSMASNSFQGARSQQDSQVSMAAAESGMAFLQRVIGDVQITGGNATGDGAMKAIFNKLKVFNGTATLGGQSITATTDPATGGYTKITIPTIAVHTGSPQRFSAELSLASAADLAADRPNIKFIVKGLNQGQNAYARTLQVSLMPKERTRDVFSYGVFAKGRIDLADGKASVIGTSEAAKIGSAYTGATAIYLHGGDLDGDVYVSGDPSVLFVTNSTSGSIGGVDITNSTTLAEALKHVHQIDPPTVPQFNPNQFNVEGLKTISQPSDLGNGHTFSNLCITGNVTFSGNDTLQGLIYVKPGVTVTFNGNPTIQGVIVVEDPNQDANGDSLGTTLTSTSKLDFQGTPIFATPVWPSGTPLTSQQRNVLNDYSVLGPTAYVYISGNSGSNKDNAGFAKTVVCGTLEEYGSGMVKIRDGTLITMSDTVVTGTQGFSSYFDGDGVQLQRTEGYHAPIGGYVKLYSWVVDSRTYVERSQEAQ